MSIRNSLIIFDILIDSCSAPLTIIFLSLAVVEVEDWAGKTLMLPQYFIRLRLSFSVKVVVVCDITRTSGLISLIRSYSCSFKPRGVTMSTIRRLVKISSRSSSVSNGRFGPFILLVSSSVSTPIIKMSPWLFAFSKYLLCPTWKRS